MTGPQGVALLLQQVADLVQVCRLLDARIAELEDRLDQLDRDGARLKELAWTAADGSRLN
jgi:hypothetical protein